MDDIVEKPNTGIIRYVNKIILDLIKSYANELHLDFSDKHPVIYLTLNDGTSKEIHRLPAKIAEKVLNRVRVMFQLGIYGAHNPTEGEIALNISKSQAVTLHAVNSPSHIVIYNKSLGDYKRSLICNWTIYYFSFSLVHTEPEPTKQSLPSFISVKSGRGECSVIRHGARNAAL